MINLFPPLRVSASPRFYLTPDSRPLTPARSAFTLVELLVVISIIGILAGLASVAGYQALLAARRAAIKTDITNLESALEKYKMDYGQFPPSNMFDFQLIRRHLQKAFPRCNADTEMRYIPDKSGVIDITQAYDSRITSANAMTPAQALVFWLQGFCSDKQHPLSAAYSATPAERTAVLDFTKTRLVDPSTKNGWVTPQLATSAPFLPTTNVPPPVYLASYGNQPYAYFEARSYIYHNNVNLYYPNSPNTDSICVPYMWDSNNDQAFDDKDWNGNGNAFLDPNEESKIYANPKSFQIVSAGIDGDFGPPNSVTKTFPRSGTPNSITITNAKVYQYGEGYGDGDNDNLTNFSEKALGDAKPE